LISRASDPTREWFRDWFGEEYLALYPHRDEEEAFRAVSLFLDSVGSPDQFVLDLACGAGRHLRELRQANVQAVGLDLSGTLLAEARRTDPPAPLVRADMRYLPFSEDSFGGLTSFFTSFGYFRTVEEDMAVIEQVRRCLAPGGSFMLDFFNAGMVRAHLVPVDVKRLGDQQVTQTRAIEGDVVVKRIVIESLEGDVPTRQFEERVRLYDPNRLHSMLNDMGLRTEHRFGDYSGQSFGPGSGRLILAGYAK
jgi:SAM-dependent methyltransferase